MNTYETVFIMNPFLSEDQIKETVKKFASHIKTNKGSVTHEENWGLKKLKYAIQKKKTGFYYLIEFQADGKILNDFEVEDQLYQNLEPNPLNASSQIPKPSIVMNGERINPPLIYGAPERWKSVQKDGFYRDKEGKIQTPLIMFKRDTVEKRRDLGNKIDANNPQLYYVFQTKYNKRNQYDNFSVLQGRTPNKEFHAVVMPDYVKLKYSFIIWTDYVAQMNKLVEMINYTSD